jgi:ATP-dependent Clp protease protease subunit
MKIKRMFAATKKQDSLELMIYDYIGADWMGNGVTAKDVASKIKDAGDIKQITVRVNSPGGNVFEGSAIYSLLAQHPAKVVCYVDGVAASAAFTIAMAADEIYCSESSLMMCHNAWGASMGSADDMRQMADLLDKTSMMMCEIYAKRSGQDVGAMKSIMDAETWMTAAEAVKMGFATATIEREDDGDEELAASFDLSHFAKVPEKLKVRSEKPEEKPEPVEEPVVEEADNSSYHKRIRIAELS